ncbi:hypothetical protein P9112_004898 [Eukaryota sp. TZLM1-RC]
MKSIGYQKVARHYFQQADPVPVPPKESYLRTHVAWKCEKCPEATYIWVSKTAGWTNLCSHIKTRHFPVDGCLLTIEEKTGPIEAFVEHSPPVPYINRVFATLDLLISGQRPFTFVEDKILLTYLNFKPVCRSTLMKYFKLLYTKVVEEVSRTLPPKIGIIVDGWNLCCWSRSRKPILLALTPFETELEVTDQQPFDDATTLLGAEQYFDIIDGILAAYNKTRQNLFFVVSDNCPTNAKLGELLGVPTIGCASHRLALELKTLQSSLVNELKAIDKMFTMLRRVKRSMVLRTKTTRRPTKRNVTRWLSAADTLKRFFQYKEAGIFQLFGSSFDDLLPNASQERALRQLYDHLTKNKRITNYLQGTKLTLALANDAFEVFHNDFPHLTVWTKYPTNNAAHPDFEAAIVKVQNKDEQSLNEREGKAIECFEKEQIADIGNGDLDIDKGMEMCQQAKKNKESKYIDLDWISATSCEVERLFSAAKRTSVTTRPNMTPASLEKQLFLLYNR